MLNPIPWQLQNENFRFCLIEKRSKRPFEKEWTTKQNYRYDDSRLLGWIREGGNCGIICGYGKLFVIDCDHQDLVKRINARLPATFRVRTGGGKFHYYYIVPDMDKKIILDNGTHLGEIQGSGTQVLCPPSIHPNGNPYVVDDDLPIAHTTKDIILTELGDFVNKTVVTEPIKLEFPKKKVPKWLANVIKMGVDKGERDHWRFVIAVNLVKRGYQEEEIKQIIREFNIRCKPPEVEAIVERHLTDIVPKALRFLQEHPDISVNDYERIVEPLEETDLSELIKQPTPTIDYWAENFIPRGALVLFGGKAGSGKSLLLLRLILDIVRGSSFLNQFRTLGSPKILLYDLEMGQNLTHRRIKYLIGDETLPENRIFMVEKFDKENMGKERERAKNYDIIVLDSYRRFLQGVENQSEITDKFYHEFYKPLREMGKTILISHHFRKGRPEEMSDDELQDLFRGSTDIVAQVDLAFGVFKTNEEILDDGKILKFEISLYKAKNRLGIPLKNFHFAVKKDDNRQKTTFAYLGEKRYETLEMVRIRKLVQFLKNGEKRAKEIYEHFSELGVTSVKAVISSAVERGLIVSDKKGYYRLPEEITKEIRDYV